MLTPFSINLFQKGGLPPPNNIGVYIERMEREGIARVKMFLVITVAYLIFWGPLFLVTLLNWSWEWKDAKKSMSHEVGKSVSLNYAQIYLKTDCRQPKAISSLIWCDLLYYIYCAFPFIGSR